MTAVFRQTDGGKHPQTRSLFDKVKGVLKQNDNGTTLNDELSFRSVVYVQPRRLNLEFRHNFKKHFDVFAYAKHYKRAI